MLLRYLKSQLMVLLCGGLVGPIFLAVYFASGQSVLLKWMFYVGLLVTAADVLIALALTSYGVKCVGEVAVPGAARGAGAGPGGRHLTRPVPGSTTSHW